MRIQLPLALLAAALMCPLFTAPAHAQRARTFVASYGVDSASCGSFGGPCRTFQQAVTNVAAGGEVTAIDSAGFGPISITKSVTITSPPGVEAGILPASGSPAVSVGTFGNSGQGNVVQLRGLTLDGTAGGTVGVSYTGAGTRVEIIGCLIHDFSGDGIFLGPSDGFDTPDSAVFISNTIVSNNGSNGIELNPNGQFALRGVLDHVVAGDNKATGIVINGSSSSLFIDLVISNSISDHNSGDGITIVGTGPGPGNVKVMMRDSTLSNNTFNGITVSDALADLYANMMVFNGNSGFSVVNSGVINSSGNNNSENNLVQDAGSLTHVSQQ